MTNKKGFIPGFKECRIRDTELGIGFKVERLEAIKNGSPTYNGERRWLRETLRETRAELKELLL